MDEQNKLAFFEGKEIRKIWYNDQWYFSIVDVIEILIFRRLDKRAHTIHRNPQTID